MTSELFISLVVALWIAGLLLYASVILVGHLRRRLPPLPLPLVQTLPGLARTGRKRYTRRARYADGHIEVVVRYQEGAASITDAYLQDLHPAAPLLEVQESVQVEA